MQTEERSAQAPISESGLIEIIKRRVGEGGTSGQDEVGVGDDAAVLRFDWPRIVLTADAMVDGVHFISGSMSWYDIGWKCIVSNQSDIAAMGAVPEHAVLTLAIPGTTQVGDLDEVLSGVIDALDCFGGKLVGGDTVSSEVIMLSVALTGRLFNAERVITRNAARPQQLIAVSGSMGSSVAGLTVLKQRLDSDRQSVQSEYEETLLNAHFRPSPRVDLVPELVSAGIECAMDVSDGLLIDLERICTASQVDAIVYADDVPICPALGSLFPDRAHEFAMTGGEDYELLYVGDADAIAQVNAAQPGRKPADFGVIGEIIPKRGVDVEVTVLDDSGRAIEFHAKGWDHFAVR